MTYITYEKRQFSDYRTRPDGPMDSEGFVQVFTHSEGVHRFPQPPKKIPMIVPKPTFMPNRLVRVSDMKVVRGSEISEGYCTLSYSWSQSGELVKNATTGEIERYDHGKHKIIFPPKVVRKKPRGRKRIPRKTKFVKFEGIIQEICKDFNIKYIWYDQMCINQNDKEEKHGEIGQMHKIYSNAYCTIALVPELQAYPPEPIEGVFSWNTRYRFDRYSISETQWMSRIWTLEEAIMSSKMLFIGRNAHIWWYQTPDATFPIFRKNPVYTIAIILHHAHTRTSTKEHDHVFALANVLPDVMKKITVDYHQDIKELMIRFYDILAEKDLSILCFEKHIDYSAMFENINQTKNSCKEETDEYSAPVQKFNLPSWTGVNGVHIQATPFKTSFKNYTINGRTMQVTCTGLTNDQRNTTISALASITPDDIPPCPQTDDGSFWSLVIPIKLQGRSSDKSIYFYRLQEGQYDIYLENTIECILLLTHFMSFKKEDIQWVPSDEVSTIWFNLHRLTETLDNFSQYTLLTGVQFKYPEATEEYASCPVIKKDGDYYKAIGLCHIEDHVGCLLQDKTSKEQIYEIQ